MSVHTIAVGDALARWAEFSAVIDARSPDEYAEDRLPGAVNWPSLDNEERRIVGTLYKQVSPFEAQKRGAALVAANIARHIERDVLDKTRDWRPLIYCWRGGKRSNSLALVLGQIGFRVHVLEGGYKAFRAIVMEQVPALAARLRYRVVCGPTGVGKTRLLQALAEQGAQVLDLEALASHRSSVLGQIPGRPQPSQRRFETLIWEALHACDPARLVYVESESRKVGNLAVPEGLITAMRASPCLRLELPMEERVRLLMEDYAYFISAPETLCERLGALVQLRSRPVVSQWQSLVREGQTAQVVRELLEAHYDPGYNASIQRNFSGWEAAPVLQAADGRPATLRTVAAEILAREAPVPGEPQPAGPPGAGGGAPVSVAG